MKVFINCLDCGSKFSQFLANSVRAVALNLNMRIAIVHSAPEADILIVEKEDCLPVDLRPNQNVVVVNILAAQQKSGRPNVHFIAPGNFGQDFWLFLKRKAKNQSTPA